MLTEKQARRAGIESGSADAEQLFRETAPEDRARVGGGWGWSASEAALVMNVPPELRRAFCEAYELEAATVWADLVEDAEREAALEAETESD